MSRLSPLLFFILALFSAHVAFGAPSCSYSSNQTDCISRCRNKFGLSSTPSNGLPTPAVDANPYDVSTTTTSTTYSPTPSSDGGDDQPSSSSPSPTPTPTPSPTPSTSPSSSGVSADDINAYLEAHNSARAQHGANPLTWSDDLSALAQQWANGCVFQHSMGKLGPYGGKCLPSELISWLLKVATQKIWLLVLVVIIPSQRLLEIGSRKLVSHGMATVVQGS